MIKKPYVGQRVRLNDLGMDMIGGLRKAEEFRQSQDMRITFVGDFSLTDDVETFEIGVNQPTINQYLLDNHMVDAI